MPPQSTARKSSLISNAPSAADAALPPRRTNSGRAVRANASRPANYYARPFAAMTHGEPDETPAAPPGFFPALTFFTDAVTALPREVMRQFTLMKEVEAKIHGPTEALGRLCDELVQQPVPRRRDGQTASAAMMSFTASNSAAGSANASLVNGVAPYGARSGLNSTAGSTMGDDGPLQPQEGEEGLARRRRYAELRALTHNLLPNMDEKNVVLAEALRVMNLQLARIDGVMPHVEAEIPEEARLGSMTHWAYAENRAKAKPAAQGATERNRRDVAAANNLAAAASAVHETEIAQARRDAGKEAGREKHGKGRYKEQVDSEFEDRPKKTHAKTGKGKLAAAAAAAAAAANAGVMGLGISTNGEPVKRRKVDKNANALPPSMERQVSGTGRGPGKGARETPRSTPAAEPVRKTKATKAVPQPLKRRGLNSAQASPALASSPLQAQMPASGMEPPGSRLTAGRLRQNSSATNLRHEQLADERSSRPASAAGQANANGGGEKGSGSGSTSGSGNGSGGSSKPNNNNSAGTGNGNGNGTGHSHGNGHSNGHGNGGRKRARDEAELDGTQTESIEPNDKPIETTVDMSGLKREEGESRPPPSRSNSSNKVGSRRGSKTGTPRSEPFPGGGDLTMTRTRSTRSIRGGNETPGSEGPGPAPASTTSASRPVSHKRNGGTSGSVSGLMKQIAPFNRSPDLDRHRDKEDGEEDGESVEEVVAALRDRLESAGARAARRSGQNSRPGSRPTSSLHKSGASPRMSGMDGQEGRMEDRGGVVELAAQVGGEEQMADAPESPVEEQMVEDDEEEEEEQKEEDKTGGSLSPSPEAAAIDATAGGREEDMDDGAPDELEAEVEEEDQEEEDQEEEDQEEEEQLADAGEDEEDEVDVDVEDEDADPDDPNEPKYCYCLRGSYGDMVGCDNPKCPREWFHLGCTDLAEMPGEEESWYCSICRPRGGGNGGRRAGGRGRGR